MFDLQWKAVASEVRLGIANNIDSQVSWEGNLLSASNLVLSDFPYSNNVSSITSYPGLRNIHDFEKIGFSEANMNVYTFESLVFGWCLLSMFIFKMDTLIDPELPIVKL